MRFKIGLRSSLEANQHVLLLKPKDRSELTISSRSKSLPEKVFKDWCYTVGRVLPQACLAQSCLSLRYLQMWGFDLFFDFGLMLALSC